MEQINDHQGNSFWPNAKQWALHRAGWRVVERRRNGMIRIVKWRSPEGEICSQGDAFRILQEQKAYAKLKFNVFVEGSTDPVNPIPYADFEAARVHAVSLANWSLKAVVKETTGIEVQTFAPYSEERWQRWQEWKRGERDTL